MQEGFQRDSNVSTIDKDVLIKNIIEHFIEFYDIDSKEDSFSPVIDIKTIKTNVVIEMLTNIGSKIVCGPDTLIYVLNKSDFIPASKIELNDQLVCPTGESIQYIVDIYENSELDESNNEISIINSYDENLGYFIEGALVKNNNNIM